MQYVDTNKMDCGFECDVAGYLYGEIDPDLRRVIEGHAASCSSCAEELAGLSKSVRAVADWKSLEFSKLDTPRIQLSNVVPHKKSGSIWDVLRNFRIAVPAFSAAAALTILGVALFLGSGPVEVPDVSELVTPASPVAHGDASILPTEATSGSSGSDTAKSRSSVSTATEPKTSSIKRLRPLPVRESRENMTVPATRGHRPMPFDGSIAKGQRTTPNLNGYEDKEDETLRLEDIFSEIDAS